VNNNGQTGILALSGSTSTLRVHLDRVQVHGNGNAGFALTSGATATVVSSSATSNLNHCFYADSGSQLNLSDSVSAGNVNSGISSVAGATVRMSNVTVTNNGAGLTFTPGSHILSYGNNSISGNYGANGPPTGMVVPQ
jgi:Right handed beta helix region